MACSVRRSPPTWFPEAIHAFDMRWSLRMCEMRAWSRQAGVRTSGMMTAVFMLSQIIVGVRDLDASADRFRSMGFDVVDGGVHPGVGTANRVVPLGGQYIELLGVVAFDEAREHPYGRSLLRATQIFPWVRRSDPRMNSVR